VIPEGGSNALGVRGCRTVAEELNSQAPDVDLICCSVGTGGMLAGLAAGLRPGQRALGFAALKPGPSLDLDAETAALQRLAFGARRGSWHIDHRYHFGGYGRTTPELKAFAARVADRQEETGESGVALDLDLTYEAKALYGLIDLAERGTFRRGGTLALIIAG
jgi:1-aminocyclopropane-1-carboxylate deaminase